MRWAKQKAPGPVDPDGRRLIGFTLEGDHPIFAPPSHSLLLSANGGGKTRRGALVWLYSFLSSPRTHAMLMVDGKNGEMAIQAAKMAAKMGHRVAVIDDMGVWPELEPYRVSLNPFGAVVSVYKRDPLDLIFTTETINNALIPEPPEGGDKDTHFRDVPRDLFLTFVQRLLLKRNPETTTPGTTSAILNDPDLLRSLAEMEASDNDPGLGTPARNLLQLEGHEHWPQHPMEAQRSLKLFAPGTRLHEAGLNVELTHEDLIREGYVIFLVGPQGHHEPAWDLLCVAYPGVLRRALYRRGRIAGDLRRVHQHASEISRSVPEDPARVWPLRDPYDRAVALRDHPAVWQARDGNHRREQRCEAVVWL